jgi:hypothetical protein
VQGTSAIPVGIEQACGPGNEDIDLMSSFSGPQSSWIRPIPGRKAWPTGADLSNQ